MSIRTVEVYNGSAPGADTAVFTARSHNANRGTAGSDTTRNKRPAYILIQIQVATSTVVYVRLTDGTTTKNLKLNGAVALTAGALYEFKVSVPASPTTKYTYTVMYSTDSVTDFLTVDEAVGVF